MTSRNKNNKREKVEFNVIPTLFQGSTLSHSFLLCFSNYDFKKQKNEGGGWQATRLLHVLLRTAYKGVSAQTTSWRMFEGRRCVREACTTHYRLAGLTHSLTSVCQVYKTTSVPGSKNYLQVWVVLRFEGLQFQLKT